MSVPEAQPKTATLLIHSGDEDMTSSRVETTVDGMQARGLVEHVHTGRTTVSTPAPDVSSAADVSDDVIGSSAPAEGLAASAGERSPATSGDSSAHSTCCHQCPP